MKRYSRETPVLWQVGSVDRPKNEEEDEVYDFIQDSDPGDEA
jgi:hypothetical protein